MDKVSRYRTLIQQLIQKYGKYSSSDKTAEIQFIFDTVNDHYQLLKIGWQNEKRIHSCFLHFDIKNQKIWIQHNGLESSVANELVDSGVPKEDIVLGFYTPFRRKFTGFAVE